MSIDPNELQRRRRNSMIFCGVFIGAQILSAVVGMLIPAAATYVSSASFVIILVYIAFSRRQQVNHLRRSMQSAQAGNPQGYPNANVATNPMPPQKVRITASQIKNIWAKNDQGWEAFERGDYQIAIRLADAVIGAGTYINDQELMCYGKDLLASALSMSESSQDWESSVVIFQEIASISETYVSKQYLELAKEKLLSV